jgi:hypothetical protein
LYIIKHYTMKAYGALYKAPWSHCIGAWEGPVPAWTWKPKRKIIVSCQRIARQRLDKHPALYGRNNRTAGLCNLFLGNGSVNTLPRRQWRHTTVDRDHVTCFL